MSEPVLKDYQLLGPDGRSIQELHFNNDNVFLTPDKFISNYSFKFSNTLDAHIHSAGLAMRGAAFAAADDGHMYWWSDATKFTDFLMLHQGGPQQKMTIFTDEHPWVVPAGRVFCIRWYLSYPQVCPRQPFGDLIFTMHQPPAGAIIPQ